MQRLVIALTTLLTLVAAAVVAGYLFVFAAQSDRAARAVPADASIYVSLYLQPSTGQKLNLSALLGRVPGFSDPSLLDQKIHEITARLLGEAGIDYEGDVRPWLGNQLAIALEPAGLDPEAAAVLLVVGVRDRAAAADALDRLAADLSLAADPEEYQGISLMVGEEASWALLDDILLVGSSVQIVEDAIDAEAGRSGSLRDAPRFQDAMETLPADHLASVYLDLEGMAGATGVEDELGGYSTASLALVVENDGLRLAGSAPFAEEAAPSPAREAFALASEPSSLSEWMPESTQVEAVVFGLSQTLRAAEQQLGGQDATGEIRDAITQLRALALLGLGIDVDADLLPLFDRETGIAVTGLGGSAPHGQLLLRPSDPEAAMAGLARMQDALEQRGAAVTEVEADGVTVTTVEVPQLGTLAYASRDGVVVVGMSVDDVMAALSARADGRSLAEDERYRAAWDLAGTRGGNEVWVDAAALVEAAGDDLGVTGELRDILLRTEALAMTAPAREQHSEFHVVLTVR